MSRRLNAAAPASGNMNSCVKKKCTRGSHDLPSLLTIIGRAVPNWGNEFSATNVLFRRARFDAPARRVAERLARRNGSESSIWNCDTGPWHAKMGQLFWDRIESAAPLRAALLPVRSGGLCRWQKLPDVPWRVAGGKCQRACRISGSSYVTFER